jgi:hypothetical protein
MVEYTIKAAMGIDCSDLKMVEPVGFWSYHVVHSHRAGVLRDIVLDEGFRKNNLVVFEQYRAKGERVETFAGANKTLGTMILKFGSMDEMLEKMNDMSPWVRVEVDRD